MFFKAVEYTALLASPSLSERNEERDTPAGRAARTELDGGERRMENEDGSLRCSQDGIEFEIDE